MGNHDNSHIPKLILTGTICAIAGAWWKSQQIDEQKKSRIEKDDPEFVDEVRSKVSDLLNELEIIGDVDSEDEFRDIIADYLEEHSEYQIEVAPHTAFGKPDILIEGTLALEAKYSPDKTEMDRSIGQCANYSREWVTWIVLFDTPQSKGQYLRNVLDDKGLDNIPIVFFD
jgi:hypothetical protein